MRCVSCGLENGERAKFCIECGGLLQNCCPSCGSENLPQAKFCKGCGTALGLASRGQQAQQALGAELIKKDLQIQALRAQVAEKGQQVHALSTQVSDLRERLSTIEVDYGWRLLQKVKQVRLWLAPRRSRRERWFLYGLRLFYLGAFEGPNIAFQRGLNRLRRREQVGTSLNQIAEQGGPLTEVALSQASEASVDLVQTENPTTESRGDDRQQENRNDVMPPTPNGPVRFPEHGLAHQLLGGLKGLEIGAAAYNPFGLNTRNVAPQEDYEFYAEEARKLGVEPALVDIVALADDIPVPDRSEDFILSSHVVEHLPNAIKSFLEWDRIVRDGGYVFMIVPLKGALPADELRELTPLEHFVTDYRDNVTIETHPVEGFPAVKMGHYHTFTPDSVLEVVEWMKKNDLCNWELVARENVDSKVGNGFTLAFRVKHEAA